MIEDTDGCLLLGEKGTSELEAATSAFDPNETSDALKEAGAPRGRVGLEYLTLQRSLW